VAHNGEDQYVKGQLQLDEVVEEKVMSSPFLADTKAETMALL
jgi:hypothetical protein